MMKKILIILILILSNCGYQPLHLNKPNDLIFKEIELIGENDINRRIISALSIKKNDNEYSLKKIVLKSGKRIIETSRDTSGQPISFKMILTLKITTINMNDIITEKEISKEFTYRNKENKFDLSEYEIDVQNNIIDRIIEELIIHLKI